MPFVTPPRATHRHRRLRLSLAGALCAALGLTGTGVAHGDTADAADAVEVASFDPATHDWAASAGPRRTPNRVLEQPTTYRSGQSRIIQQRVRVPASPGLQRAWIEARGAVDVGVRDCQARHWMRSMEGGRLVVEHCDVETTGRMRPIVGSALRVRDNVITSQHDGIAVTGAVPGLRSSIVGNLITREGRHGDTHHDGIQVWNGGNVSILRNRIEGWHTSAILVKADRGPIDRVVIRDNYLGNDEGWYVLYVMENPGTGHGKPTNVAIRDNVFAAGTDPKFAVRTGYHVPNDATFVRTWRERNRAIQDGVTDAAEWIVWSGNRIEGVDGELAPPGGWTSYP